MKFQEFLNRAQAKGKRLFSNTVWIKPFVGGLVTATGIIASLIAIWQLWDAYQTGKGKQVYTAPILQQSGSCGGMTNQYLSIFLISVGSNGKVINVLNAKNDQPYTYTLYVAKDQNADIGSNFNDFAKQQLFDAGNKLWFEIELEKGGKDYNEVEFDIITSDQDGNPYRQRAVPKWNEYCVLYELSEIESL